MITKGKAKILGEPAGRTEQHRTAHVPEQQLPGNLAQLDPAGRGWPGVRRAVDDPFFGDIGAAFDLVTIRNGTGQQGGGLDAFAGFNVHTTALQVPITAIKGSGDIVGIWAASSRPKVTVEERQGPQVVGAGLPPGNPLVNELIVPTADKDEWNAMCLRAMPSTTTTS